MPELCTVSVLVVRSWSVWKRRYSYYLSVRRQQRSVRGAAACVTLAFNCRHRRSFRQGPSWFYVTITAGIILVEQILKVRSWTKSALGLPLLRLLLFHCSWPCPCIGITCVANSGIATSCKIIRCVCVCIGPWLTACIEQCPKTKAWINLNSSLLRFIDWGDVRLRWSTLRSIRFNWG